MDAGFLFAAGVVAGLGVAVPLGAIGVLLINFSATHGWRTGAAGAAAVAAVDVAYCVGAILFGMAAAPVIRSWGDAPLLLGGAVLIGLGLRGLWVLRRDRRAADPRSAPAPVKPGAAAVFAAFLGLTALNPATLLYFLALTSGLAGLTGGAALSLGAALPFVAGVGLASAVWQHGLVTAGALVGARITARGRNILSGTGFTVVILLGAGAIAASLR